MSTAEIRAALVKAEVEQAFELAVAMQYRTAMAGLLAVAGVVDPVQLAGEIADNPAHFGYPHALPPL